MTDRNVLNPQIMQANLEEVKALMRRIRQKDPVGSDQDELVLARLVSDFEAMLGTIANIAQRIQEEKNVK